MSGPRRAGRPLPRKWGRATASRQRSWIVGVLLLLGSALLLYPDAASWFAAVNQANLIEEYRAQVEDADPSPSEQLQVAAEYNAALDAGALIEAGERKPTGDGVSRDVGLDYDSILTVDETGIMGGVKVPVIGVDLPIFHGTSDETLLRGAGHLEGSHLPIGGSGTHAVITAHRGLAEAAMFTQLDRVAVGDRVVVEVFGRALSYVVREVRVVEPDDTDSLRPARGKDLLTLVTCTPLGINTHRILVTAERVLPTPSADVAGAHQPSHVGFPTWVLGVAAAVVLALAYGLLEARARRREVAAASSRSRVG